MRIVVAFGGNALLRRGEPMTADSQRANIRIACEALAPVAVEHQLVVSHGNGPQVGLLALQAAAYAEVEPYPLDVLGSQTEGMIGYMIEQELGNLLPVDKRLATILTMVVVEADDPAFQRPTKPIGPVYTEQEAKRVVAARGWTVAPDGGGFRRVVPSPLPKRIVERWPIEWLLDRGCVVICAGGGGIPTRFDEHGKLRGVEAVIDKDRASGLLARELHADVFVMATDVDAVYVGWGTPQAKAIERASPAALAALAFAGGSMGPKVEAACEFATRTGRAAAIGALEDLGAILAGKAGTLVASEAAGIDWRG